MVEHDAHSLRTVFFMKASCIHIQMLISIILNYQQKNMQECFISEFETESQFGILPAAPFICCS
uniref:hypothetical protein n=1 Tax=Vibrio vulnificus TaxID=672 RepID=UPI0019D4BEC1